MTAPILLTIILSALSLQVAVGILFAVRRHPARPDQTEADPPGGAPRGAWAGLRRFRVARREAEDIAQTQVSFYLEPEDGGPLPPFRPGQYLTLSVTCPAPPGSPQPRPLTRCYSLSDQPDPSRYRITVKRVGIVSNFLHDTVREGSTIEARCPAGGFHIDDDDTPAVLIAGGVGVTPIMSMLLWSQTVRPGRALWVFYAVRHGGEHAFKHALEHIAATHAEIRLTIVYSRPGPLDRPGLDYQHEGRIDIDLLRSTLPDGPHKFYICGPSAMMETLVPALRAWGTPEADLHFEAFGPASVGQPAEPPVAAAGIALDVAFRRSSRTLVWDGGNGNLLDFAERHGIAVESGCRTGACGACETRVLSGEVRYAQTPEFDVSPDCCLLCVGAPSSSLVLEA